METGSIVYLMRINKQDDILPGVITKIGRKYVEIEAGNMPVQFDRESRKHNNGNMLPKWMLFLTKNELHEYEEKTELFHEVKEFMGRATLSSLTLVQIKSIHSIINNEGAASDD